MKDQCWSAVRGRRSSIERASNMQVLMTTDTVGGVWCYALQLARGLVDHGYRTVLATMGDLPTSRQIEEANSVPGLQLQISPYLLEWMEDPWEDVERAGDWLLQLERDHAPDLVHLNGYAHGCLPWRAPCLVVGHSCVLSWWRAVRHEEAPGFCYPYRRAVEAGLQAADLVAAPTETMRRSLDRDYGPFKASRVVPNGRDASAFPVRRKEPFILSAGRLWDQAKNLNALDAIAADLPWPVYVAGSATSPIGGTIEIPDVKLLGHLPPEILAEWFGRASIYALPARYEPFGLSALEAGLAGCALVLGDIASLRETWEGAALFVSPEDPDALRSALLSLVQDERRRLDLGRRAHERARQYPSERMIRGYLEAYQSLVASAPRPVLSGA